jgi:cytochrome c oxidase cbb3-type subunit 3
MTNAANPSVGPACRAGPVGVPPSGGWGREDRLEPGLQRCRRLALLFLALAAGCNWPGKPNPANKPVMPDQVVQPEKLFGKHCAGCHGAAGKTGPAPPLNDPLFRAIVPEDALVRVITEGRPGTPMPAFAREKGGPLTDEQVLKLARGIKAGITPDWGPSAKLEEKVPPYLLPTKPGEREAGKAVFSRVCSGCHGDSGKGGDMAGAINQPAFLALISEQALRRIVLTGRPDLKPAMPSLVAPEKP